MPRQPSRCCATTPATPTASSSTSPPPSSTATASCPSSRLVRARPRQLEDAELRAAEPAGVRLRDERLGIDHPLRGLRRGRRLRELLRARLAEEAEVLVQARPAPGDPGRREGDEADALALDAVQVG